MKLKDSDKGILLIIAGIAIAVLSVIYVAKPNYEEVQTINGEIVQLQQRLDRLNSLQANRQQYEEDTKKFKEEFEERLGAFPADMNQEITIMFLEGIKDSNTFSIDSLEMGEPEQFYTLGLGGGDASLDATGTAATTASTEAGAAGSTEATTAASTEATTAASTEATTAAGATTAAAGGELQEGAETGNDADYKCYRAIFPISYYGDYASLKNVIDYVGSYSDRMTINSLNVAYDAENDEYSGELELYCYSVESSERDERKIDLNDVEIGVENIFDNGISGKSSSEDQSLNKYNDNDGAAIVSNYDFYAMLNPSSSDVSAKVVGQNGTGKEASVISNNDNTVSTLSFDFYEKDGKNYCKYTLDNSTSYEAEVTSAEDVKVLLQSSARKDDSDDAGIRVTIRNTMKIPVYVKVTGDDTVKPRVDVASSSGSVKVYK